MQNSLLQFVIAQPQPPYEIIPVSVIIQYLSAFDAPFYDMMEGAGSIYAGFSWHIFCATYSETYKFIF